MSLELQLITEFGYASRALNKNLLKNHSLKTMGNQVSAASPPPECPMHKQEAPPPPKPTKISECPVKHDLKVGDKSDINPYNMVCFYFNQTFSLSFMVF